MSFKILLVSGLLTLALPTLAADPMAPLFEAYQQLQSALAGDDFTAAKTAAQHLQTTAGEISKEQLVEPVKTGWESQAAHLKMAVQSATQAGDIEVLRQNFEPISMAMIALAKVAKPAGFQEFHCPMALDSKGANWLQKGEEAANPYFGSAMLRCGAPVISEEERAQH